MALVSKKRCLRCGGHGTLLDLGLCVGCGLALYKSLGDAAMELSHAKRPEQPARPISVLDAVQEKRRRTGSYRFFAAPSSIRGTGP